MREINVLDKKTARLILLAMCVIALAVLFAVVLPQPAQADTLPPDVPDNLKVTDGSKVFFVGHAVGTQNYICMPSGVTYAWTFFGPQATLFDDEGKQVSTHFLSLNPAESGTARPTWQHSRDTSSVWAAAVASSTDPNYVASGAIPWLKLQVVGSQNGPTGGDKLSATTFIQRINTTGGLAPSTGCQDSNDLGKKAFVDYTADYFFYR